MYEEEEEKKGKKGKWKSTRFSICMLSDLDLALGSLSRADLMSHDKISKAPDIRERSMRTFFEIQTKTEMGEKRKEAITDYCADSGRYVMF